MASIDSFDQPLMRHKIIKSLKCPTSARPPPPPPPRLNIGIQIHKKKPFYFNGKQNKKRPVILHFSHLSILPMYRSICKQNSDSRWSWMATVDGLFKSFWLCWFRRSMFSCVVEPRTIAGMRPRDVAWLYFLIFRATPFCILFHFS